jgi:hypothetical protein
LGILRQAPVPGRNLQHLALRWRMGHVFGLEPGFLSTVQPILRVACFGWQNSPSEPPSTLSSATQPRALGSLPSRVTVQKMHGHAQGLRGYPGAACTLTPWDVRAPACFWVALNLRDHPPFRGELIDLCNAARLRSCDMRVSLARPVMWGRRGSGLAPSLRLGFAPRSACEDRGRPSTMSHYSDHGTAAT